MGNEIPITTGREMGNEKIIEIIKQNERSKNNIFNGGGEQDLSTAKTST